MMIIMIIIIIIIIIIINFNDIMRMRSATGFGHRRDARGLLRSRHGSTRYCSPSGKVAKIRVNPLFVVDCCSFPLLKTLKWPPLNRRRQY